MTTNITDQLNFVSHTKAQQAAFAAIDRFQQFNAGQQVAAAALRKVD